MRHSVALVAILCVSFSASKSGGFRDANSAFGRSPTRDVSRLALQDDTWEEGEVKFPGEDAAEAMCASAKDGKVVTKATKCQTQCLVLKTDKGITSMCDPSQVCSHPGALAGLDPNALPPVKTGSCIKYCKEGSCVEMHCTKSWLGTSAFPSSCTTVQSSSPAPPSQPPAPPSKGGQKGGSTAQCVMITDGKLQGALEDCAPGVKQCQITELSGGKLNSMCDNAKLCEDPGRLDGSKGKFSPIADGKCITTPLTKSKIYCHSKWTEKNKKIPVPCPCTGCPHRTKTTTIHNLKPSDSGAAAASPQKLQIALALTLMAAAVIVQRQ